MGNACIWYYPEEGGTVATIDVGEPLSSLFATTVPVQIGALSMAGQEFATQTRTDQPVEVSIESFNDNALMRHLEALENHLQRGGVISIAGDVDKAVAGYLVTPPARGDTSIVLGDTPWSTLPTAAGATAALVAGDELVLETGQPIVRRETQLLSVVSGSTFTIPGCRYDYTEESWVLVRHRHFFPVLRLPLAARNRPLLTTNRYWLHNFSATLEVPPPAYGAYALIGAETVIGASETEGTATLDDILNRGEGGLLGGFGNLNSTIGVGRNLPFGKFK